MFFAEKHFLEHNFKVALKESDKEKVILKVFYQFRFFYQDKIWNDDRYWEPSAGSTLHDSNNDRSKFDDLSLFCTKCEGVSFLPSNGKNRTVFFKNRKLTFICFRSI